MQRLRQEGIDDVPVVVGGIIPPDDAETLQELGVAAVYTPKDFDLTPIMRDIVAVVDQRLEGGGLSAAQRSPSRAAWARPRHG